jgi:hypothetical protein
MTSIIGTWNVRVTWHFGIGGGTELNAFDHTFKADGTFTHPNGGGRWLQVDSDLVVWNWQPPDQLLVYSANIQPGHAVPQEDSMTGIMGWLTEGGNRGTFRAQRLLVGDPTLVVRGGAPEETVVVRGGAPENNSNPALGPVADPPLGSPET